MLAFHPPSASLAIGGHRIALDRATAEHVFVSHAHADHAPRGIRRVLATPATLDLLKARNYKVEAVALEPEGARVELANAGHVLGSAQLVAELDGARFCYTGDFKLEPSLTLPGAEVPECDTLVMEATYGHPRYRFPSREEVCGQLAAWARGEIERGRSVVLGGYSLGKAQELVKLCNDFLGVTPIVSESIHALNEVYRAHGVKLDWLCTEHDEAQRVLERHEPFVAVLPSSQVNWNLAARLGQVHGRKISTAVATGWALDGRFTGVDRAFCLSDHADFRQLEEYAERSGARTIYCAFGHNEELAAHLRAKGLDARPLDEDATSGRQRTLTAFAGNA
jgi:putative mRNA 3-end processing factor